MAPSSPARSKRRASAYRESGHAVVAWRLGIALTALSVRTSDGGTNAWDKPLRHVDLDFFRDNRDATMVERLATVLLAGPIAQRRFAARAPRGAIYTSRRTAARTLLKAIHGPRGDGERLRQLSEWVTDFLDRRDATAAVEEVARRLIEGGRIDGDDAVEIIESAIEDF